MRMPARILAAVLLAAGAASAQGLSSNSQLFIDVCVANAPILSEAAIMAAARTLVPGSGTGFAQASVAVDEGQRCIPAVSGVTVPVSDVEVQGLASTFAQLVGVSSIQQVRSVVGGDFWYPVEVGGATFGVEAVQDGANVRYSINRR